MKFEFLHAKDIVPEGWLRRQLQQQAAGLNGNLDKVWRDIYDSSWLGGEIDSWERLPYFLDGFLPLAYLLRDEDRIARANKYIDMLLKGQAADGCFYPKGKEGQNDDIWSVFLILKVLTVYADCTEDPRAEGSIERGLKFLDGYIGHHPPYNWAAARWYECIIPILWLYKRNGGEWLIDLARRLKAHGLDYTDALPLWKNTSNDWTYETHVVNIAMALKSEALWCELTGDEPAGLAERMLETLFTYHGTAYGHFTGDECLSGNSPVQGSELCGVVEAMYSYEWLTALTGEAKWGDYLEALAFNGLPAAVSADMWTHQYDQQVNQIACVPFENPIFRTNGPKSNMFGLEPHYGCCTANFGQGFPKLALSAYMKKGDALVVVTPLPAQVRMGERTVSILSEYPFRARFTLSASAETEALVRVPAWTKPVCSAPYGMEEGFMRLTLKPGTETVVEFPMTPRLEARPEGRYCLKYGALLFSVPVDGTKEMYEYVENGVERKFPYCDYSISPVGEWRYAFTETKYEVKEFGYDLPFDRLHPPIRIEAELAPVEWGYEEGHELVAARAAGEKRRGANERISLQPYGATDLRVTELKLIK